MIQKIVLTTFISFTIAKKRVNIKESTNQDTRHRAFEAQNPKTELMLLNNIKYLESWQTNYLLFFGSL